MIKIIYMESTLILMSQMGIDISPIVNKGIIKDTKIGKYLVIEDHEE